MSKVLFFLIYFSFILGFLLFLWLVSSLLRLLLRLCCSWNDDHSTEARNSDTELTATKQILGRISVKSCDEEKPPPSTCIGQVEAEDHHKPPQLVVADFGEEGVITLEDCSCPICLADYENGSIVQRSASCHHVFHSQCIRRWLSHDNDECPCCRSNFALLHETNSIQNNTSISSG